MSHFVSNDVGLREIGLRSAKPFLEFVEERWIEINGPVLRTIEWTYRARSHAAAGGYTIREEHHLRRHISLTHFPELLLPHLFSESKDLRREAACTLFRGSERPTLHLAALALAGLCIAENLRELLRINSEKVANGDDEQHPNATDRNSACPGASTIFHVLAFFTLFPFHVSILSVWSGGSLSRHRCNERDKRAGRDMRNGLL
jgi:hypothetical protein